MKYIIIFLVLVVIGCKNSDKKIEKKSPQKRKPLTTLQEIKPIAELDTHKYADLVFIINREGATGKAKPNANSETIEELKFGDKFELVEDLKEWVKVRHTYSKEPVLYIRKKFVGDALAFPLTNEDLNEVDYYGEEPPSEPEVYKNIKISLISKEKFLQIKATAVNHFTDDHHVIKKEKDIFFLKTTKGNKKFKDKQEGHEYNYIGQFKVLNSYLVQFVWYEAEDDNFDLIDKNTGKKIYSFDAFPYFSTDLNLAMDLEDGPEMSCTDLVVHKALNKNVYDSYAFGRFRNWLPADTQEQFWGKDNCYYVPVLPKPTYYSSYTPEMKRFPLGYNYRYIKIEITGPSLKEGEIPAEYKFAKLPDDCKLEDNISCKDRVVWTDSIKQSLISQLGNFTLKKVKPDKFQTEYYYTTDKELKVFKRVINIEDTKTEIYLI